MSKFRRLGLPPLAKGATATVPNRTLLFAFGTVAEHKFTDGDLRKYEVKRVPMGTSPSTHSLIRRIE